MYDAAAIVLGGLIALQSRSNGELALSLQSPLAAAVVSYAVGVATLLTLATRRSPLALATTIAQGRPPLWWFAGGLTGAAFVASAAAAVPVVGVLTFSVSAVSGHLAGSLVADHLGIGPGGHRKAGGRRALGVALGVTGVVLASMNGGNFTVLASAGLFLVGAAVALGVIANGNLKLLLRSGSEVALLNFVVGTMTVTAVAVVVEDFTPVMAIPQGIPWWAWAGGVLGAAWLTASTNLVRPMGALRLFLAVTAGQVLASAVLDAAVPFGAASFDAPRAVGAGLILLAVVIVTRAE